MSDPAQQQTQADPPAAAAASVPKKEIPHPNDVHPSKHKAVMAHVGEQFAAGHYDVEEGSVRVESISPGRDRITFVRTHDPNTTAAPHGLDLSPA